MYILKDVYQRHHYIVRPEEELAALVDYLSAMRAGISSIRSSTRPRTGTEFYVDRLVDHQSISQRETYAVCIALFGLLDEGSTPVIFLILQLKGCPPSRIDVPGPEPYASVKALLPVFKLSVDITIVKSPGIEPDACIERIMLRDSDAALRIYGSHIDVIHHIRPYGPSLS